MRVICIKGNFNSEVENDNLPLPIEGESYNVCSTWDCTDGNTYYNLEEFPDVDRLKRWFVSTAFIPCSNQDNKVLDESEALGIRMRLHYVKIIKAFQRWQQRNSEEKF